MTTNEIAVGAVVRVQGGTKERRPGVVVRVFLVGEQLKVLAVWGTGTLRPEKRHVVVRPGTAAGTALAVEKPTYFYSGNVTICLADRVERRGVQCPPALLIELQALVGL